MLLEVGRMTRPKGLRDWFFEHEEGRLDMALSHGRGAVLCVGDGLGGEAS